LTTETYEQAVDRAGGKRGNSGWDAALAAIETARVLEALDKPQMPHARWHAEGERSEPVGGDREGEGERSERPA
jgi:hypothetical protein